jgi:hypothetical protein
MMLIGSSGQGDWAASVQWRARRHGIAGIYGNPGNVDSATCRI